MITTSKHHLDILFYLPLQDGEEDAAAQEVAEVGRDVEGEQPGGAAHTQPPFDPAHRP